MANSVLGLGIVAVIVIVVIAAAVVAVVALAGSKKSTQDVPTKDGSYFDGGYLAYIGYNILVNVVTGITFGIAFPWMCCLMQRWKAKHTVVCGKRQVFDGTGVQLIGKFLLWSFLTIITFGIYGFWMSIAIQKWITKHTHFVGEDDNNSYFDGGVLGLLGTNILAGIVTMVPFVGFAWSTIIKLRWLRSHTVIDSRRLVFTGTIGNFFLKYLLWGFLSVITFGIYALFVPVKNLRLEAESTIDHEHTDKALLEQSEYRNRVQNTISLNKNHNTEFEMEGLKAGINDTTGQATLLELAQGGLRVAQYLYVTRYADEQYTAEPFTTMLRASAEAGYAPAMCLYALTHEMDQLQKGEMLCKAAELGQSKAMEFCLEDFAAVGLAESNDAAAQPTLERAVFYADVLQGAGEELTPAQQSSAKSCALRLRRIASSKGASSKVSVGVIAIAVVGVGVVLAMLAAIGAMVFGMRVSHPAQKAPGRDAIETYGAAQMVDQGSL